ADTARATLAPLLGRSDVVVCAERDARTVLGLGGDPERILRELRERFAPAAGAVVLTRGAEGCLALDGEGALLHHAAFATRVGERCGTGDVFVAGLLWGLLRADLPAALAAASAVAALKCTVLGDQGRLDIADVEVVLRAEAAGLVR